MNVSLGLLDYLPLTQLPFNKVEPIESKSVRVAETQRHVDRRAEEFKNESIYAYHPHNQNRFTTQGQHVDFVIA